MRRVGGSIPAAAFMQRYLGITMTMFGFGLPSNNIHAPNERYSLHPTLPLLLHQGNLCMNMGPYFLGMAQLKTVCLHSMCSESSIQPAIVAMLIKTFSFSGTG